MSVGYGIKGVVKNRPIGPPTQRTLRTMKPVGPGGSLSHQCPHLSPPGRRGPYPLSVSASPPGLVGYLGLTVAIIPQ